MNPLIPIDCSLSAILKYVDRLTGLDSVVPARRFELLHGVNFDVMANKTASDKDKVDVLLEQVKTNLANANDPLAGWVVDGQHSRLRYDKFTEPKYVAKTKWKDRKDFDSTLNLVKVWNQDNPYRFGTERQNRVYNSLLNEIDLSAQIRDLVVGDDAQGVAKKYGYLKMNYVEPLIGLIDKKAGKKTVIYEHIENTGARPPRDLVEDLERLFLRKGIYPRDLNEKQFLISDTPEGMVLYLIDTEGYEKATKYHVAAILGRDG